jgi:aminopeptidase N
MGKNVKRLYREIQPSRYDLSLSLDAEKSSFSGRVKIKFQKTGRPSKRVTFHQKDLKVTSAKLKHFAKEKDKNIKLSRTNPHKSLDEIRLHSEEILYPGRYEAELEFSGKITDAMHGLYPCYFDYEGKKKTMYATQFESHHAREVFPCIDEPEAKAAFQLELDTPQSLTVLSNTPAASQSKKNGRLKTSFEQTPVMSSYLLAFVAGELHNVEAETKTGVKIRTWATVAQPKKLLQYANEEAVKALEFFTDYFQTPYPLQKCDQVALPDFESGAMENWGLVTYREVALLTDPDNRSLANEQYISMIIAHELSHQWFGNLVTMKWWDDLWLNESFASLMEHIALDAMHPDWQWWEHYVMSDILVAANRDIYKDVQPVGVDVAHPDEITTLFDPAIVYAKGGRLLKMMREFIGEEAFRSGLKDYFAGNAYKNAERGDLWKALSKSSKLDVSALMTPWIEQSGMPLLSVIKDEKGIHLSQQRFLLDGEDTKTIWPIALLPDTKLRDKVLDKKSAILESKAPILFNTHGSGHYLVDYNGETAKKALVKAVAKQKIPTEGRIIRLNDIILLARKGNTSLTEALDIVSECRSEPREAVWGMMNRVIGLAKMLVEGDKKTEDAAKKLQRELAKPHLDKLGWERKPNENPNDTLLRQTILGILLSGEDKEVIEKSIALYKAEGNVENLPAELRLVILTAIVRFGDPKEIDRLLDIYKDTQNADIKSTICAAATETRDPKIIKDIIQKTIAEGGFVRAQDIFRWFAYFMRSQYSRELAWDWVTSDWQRLEKLFGGSKSMDYMPTYSAAPLSTPEWEAKYKKFYTPLLSNRQLERNIKIGFSEISARVEWREREEQKLKKYFKS